MPFKSKKQKRTIDAAAHNPTFAKKVGIKVADAKKMSAHGKGQTKFEEDRTEVKDKDGKVTSWRDETPWRKAQNKDGRGKVTNLSDKARRETEKLSKAEKEMAESFEKAISEVKVTSGPNKGKEWTPKTMGPTNPAFKKQAPDPRFYDPDGESAPPTKPKAVKKAEVTPTDDTVSTDTEVAESKKKPSKIKTAMKMNKIKSLKENIKLVSQLLAEAKKKEEKCNECGMYESKCSCDHSKDEKKVAEALKGGQKKIAKAAPPADKITGADFKALKKNKKTEEAIDQNKDGKNDFEDVKIARMKAALKGKKKVKESYSKEELASRLFEHEDDQMVDDESSMSKAELLEIAKNAMAIFRMIKDGENLDAWVAEYIGIANDHLNSIAEQMNGEEAEQEMSPDDAYMESLRLHLNSLKG